MKFLLAILFVLLLIFQIHLFLFDFPLFSSSPPPLKIGLIYSLTGFRAEKEKLGLQGALMAIEEINQKGGVRGRQLQPIIRDAQSSWGTTKAEIEHLISEESIDVFLGAWNQASRYTIKTLFEKHQRLLINPFQYEGIISSPYIVWVGISINQQVPPTIAYCLENFGNRFYLVGTDYLIPHIINIMVKDQLNTLNGEVLGESYLDFKVDEPEKIDAIVRDIAQKKPDVILSSINGETNRLFFKKLREAGITPEQVPSFAFMLTTSFSQDIDLEDVVGSFATWNYFESIDTPLNHDFVSRFQEFAGSNPIDNATEASYIGVHLWAQAVEESGSTDAQALSYALSSMRFNAPEGPVTMDSEGQHAWKFSRIGRLKADGQFDIVWQSKAPIRPTPFQVYRSEAEWIEFTDRLYKQYETPEL